MANNQDLNQNYMNDIKEISDDMEIVRSRMLNIVQKLKPISINRDHYAHQVALSCSDNINDIAKNFSYINHYLTALKNTIDSNIGDFAKWDKLSRQERANVFFSMMTKNIAQTEENESSDDDLPPLEEDFKNHHLDDF